MAPGFRGTSQLRGLHAIRLVRPLLLYTAKWQLLEGFLGRGASQARQLL